MSRGKKMSKNYLKVANQGNILQNLIFLNAMKESKGYQDENGYFSKKAVAEIGVNSVLITSKGGRFGKDILPSVNDDSVAEDKNSVLQNAKQRMQILRILGLLSTDYNSELYAITELGDKILDGVFPNGTGKNQDFRLLLEAFMSISSTSEVYDFKCDLSFNCVIGYEICYALANLDYMISVNDMTCIPTYDVDHINDFIETVKQYRSEGKEIPVDHEHFPKTQSGNPLKQNSNITRTINQTLRECGILGRGTKKINGTNYYFCTNYGKQYTNEIKASWNKFIFWTPQEFRKTNILKQKEICIHGYNNMLNRGGYKVDKATIDRKTVFSPYQMIPEVNVNWLMGKKLRKAPVLEKTRLQILNGQVPGSDLKLKPEYFSLDDYTSFLTKCSNNTPIVSSILQLFNNGVSKDKIIEKFYEDYKNSDKSDFYPFICSLIKALDLKCKINVGRYDMIISYKNHIIPGEIKSPTETRSYNMKGMRQALENKIISFKNNNDLDYASLLIGFDSPYDVSNITELIDAAHSEWNIKIIAIDLKNLLSMVMRTLCEHERLDFDKLFTSFGIMEAN